MTVQKDSLTSKPETVYVERYFPRFTLGQRWEHGILILSVFILLITGLPQKYPDTLWGQWIISSPERLNQIQQIHHVFALLLFALAVYHFGRIFVQIIRKQLPGGMLPEWQDVRDAWQMIKFLLFLTRNKPNFGKYNFEQKFTYWMIFFGVGIMILSGLILWFPIQVTKIFPGGVIPAAFLAHSNEAIALAVFIVIWHFFHVHLQRLNLSIFTGRINEDDLRKYHENEFERLRALNSQDSNTGGGNP